MYLVLTSDDVTVEGFCMSCGFHGNVLPRKNLLLPYAWVGNSKTQCPGQCAWSFHQTIYGAQTPPLVALNGNMSIDGMIINIATVLAGAVTNPFNNGYFQGDKGTPLEAVSACPRMYGMGSYSGFPGNLLVEKTTGASYNGNGVNGHKFLLPAIWDPSTRVWYGTGSYSGFTGNLLVDKTTGVSYNGNGVNGHKFLLPAIWDPSTRVWYGTGSYSGFTGNLLVDKTTGASYNGNGVNGHNFLLPAIWDPSTRGWYGTGSYLGFTGNLLVDKTTGVSYNGNGVNGRKFLLPAIWDPSTRACKTLV